MWLSETDISDFIPTHWMPLPDPSVEKDYHNEDHDDSHNEDHDDSHNDRGI